MISSEVKISHSILPSMIPLFTKKLVEEPFMLNKKHVTNNKLEKEKEWKNAKCKIKDILKKNLKKLCCEKFISWNIY